MITAVHKISGYYKIKMTTKVITTILKNKGEGEKAV